MLEVEGTQSGPFSLEQIRGLYEEGEILGHHKLASAQDPANARRWVTIEAFFRPTPFKAPPRPPGSEESGAASPTISPDVADSLFDALQAARERKAGKLAPPVSTTRSEPTISVAKLLGFVAQLKESAKGSKANPRLVKIVLVGLLVAAAVWGVTRYLKKPGGPAPESEPEQRVSAPRSAEPNQPSREDPLPNRPLPPIRGMAPAPNSAPPPPRPPGEDLPPPPAQLREEQPYDPPEANYENQNPEESSPPPIHSDEGIDEMPPQEALDGQPDAGEGIVPPPPPPLE